VAGGEERRGSRYSLRSEVTAETRGEANEIGMVGVRGEGGERIDSRGRLTSVEKGSK